MSWALWRDRIGVSARRGAAVASTMLLVAACAGSSATEIAAPDYSYHSARTLAVAPPDSLFANTSGKVADAVGVELGKHGYVVIDSAATSSLLAKHHLTPSEVLAPAGLAALGSEGVDGVLSVESKSAGMGGPDMRHVTAKVMSTRTSKSIAEIEWNNSWAGMPGSIADYVQREGVEGAAKDIADRLAKLLG